MGLAALPHSVRKASGFPSALLNYQRLRRGRRSLGLWGWLVGKSEAFRTEGGKAAFNGSKATRHLLPPAPLAATCAACSCHLPSAYCRCLLPPVPSFSNYLHQHPLSAAAIKFAVENLFPRAEVELAFCNRDDNFTAH